MHHDSRLIKFLFVVLAISSPAFSLPQSLPPERLPCTLPNIALVGGDLSEADGGGGVRVNDARECKFECDRRAPCRFWTFVDEWRINCYLKAEAGEEKTVDGATTGWKAGPECGPAANPIEEPTVQGILDDSGCKRDDVAFLGADLPKELNGDGIAVRSWVECRTECRLQSGCGAYTFVKEWDQNCFLKESRGEEAEFIGAVSGTLDACEDSERTALVRRPSSGVGGGASRLVPTVPPPAPRRTTKPPRRQSLIGRIPTAPSRSRRPPTSSPVRTPSRKPLRRPPTSRNPPPSSTSIFNSIPTAPPVAGFGGGGGSSDGDKECVFLETNFLGGGLTAEEGGQGIETPDHAACNEQCKKHVNCHFWTFVSKWKVNCYLKSRLGEKADFEGGVSGAYGRDCEKSELSGGAVTSGSSSAGSSSSTGGSSFSKDTNRGRECRFEETNFLGGGLSAEDGGQGIETADVDLCSEECLKRPKCKFWSFVGKWKVNCYLKEKLGEKTEYEGSIAGTYGASCDALEQGAKLSQLAPGSKIAGGSSDECLFAETNFLGGGLTAEEGGQGIETSDHQACSDECRKRPACHYWTFVKQWKINCYLKKRLGEKAEFEGGTSGTYGQRCNLDGSPSPPSSAALIQAPVSSAVANSPFSTGSKFVGTKDSAGCRYEGVNLLGGDLPKEKGGHGIPVIDADECRNECGRRNECAFWTFVGAWEINCYLKEMKGPEKSMAEAVSGTLFVSCEEAEEEELGELGQVRTSDHECAYQNTNLLGADLPAKHGGLGIPETSAEDCRFKCLQEPFCRNWVFVKDWRVSCYLKSGKVSLERGKEGFVSGSIGERCLPGSTGLANIGTGIQSGAVLGSAIDSDHRFNPLLVVAPGNNNKDHCTYPGLNYQGGDLTDSQGGNGLATSVPEDCAAECEKRSVCSYWTFVKDWKVNCYLKSSFDEANGKESATSGSIGVSCKDYSGVAAKVTEAAAPSAPVAGGAPVQNNFSLAKKSSNKVPAKPTSQPDNVCFFNDVSVVGGDLPASQGGEGINVSDSNQCAIQCYQTDGCVYWVHLEGYSKNCFLKSHFTSEEARDGATSGSIGLAC